jgi:hypothetical protein
MRSQEGSDSKDEDALALFAKLLSDTDEAVPESGAKKRTDLVD